MLRARDAIRCIVALIAGGAAGSFAELPDSVSHYDLVWETPSADSSGSMPLGNGDLAVNVWVDPGGDLLFYLAKSDALSEINRLLKLGRVRLRLQPNVFQEHRAMRQTLRLADGCVEVVLGTPGDAASQTLRLWVDANHPVVRIEAASERPFVLDASAELWRTEARTLRGNEGLSALEVDERKWEGADKVVPSDGRSVVWYHRNAWSWFPNNLRKQNLAPLLDHLSDPLANRTFGVLMQGDGFVATDDRTLRAAAATTHGLTLTAHTSQPSDADTWVRDVRTLAARVGRIPREQAWREHRAYWGRAWETSFLRIRTPAAPPPGGALEPSRAPLCIGSRRDGAHRFLGALALARLSRGELPAAEIARRARGLEEPVDAAEMIAAWRFDRVAESYAPTAGMPGLSAQVVGTVLLEDGDTPAIRLAEGSRIEVAHAAELLPGGAFTLEAWVKLDADGGGMLFDKSGDDWQQRLQLTVPRPGASTGHLISREVPNLTFLVRNQTLHTETRVPFGPWVHLAATYDPGTGRRTLHLNGVELARAPHDDSPDRLAQFWHLQRLMNLGAGRGAVPIKFNGSLFTFATAAHNADFRRWGGCYWFQNTRLIYWPMLASGDYDLMRPFFRMYSGSLELARARTRTYYGHDGAFWPETITSWGSLKEGDYTDSAGLAHIRSAWIRRYYSGNLELLAMMLNYWEHTLDREFLAGELLPVARDVLTYYWHRTARDEQGRILFDPSQALETYQKARNPANEIAGLLDVLPRLLDLPADAIDEETRRFWRDMLTLVPPLPRRALADGREILAAVEKAYGERLNSENPELYSVFPFRLFGVGRPGLEIARDTFGQRVNRAAWSWQQNDTQAALLGLTDEAAAMVMTRARGGHYRFPAFWQHGNDWAPDGCHGGNFTMALQSMLLQEVGGEILLFPAWPAEWNVHFRLHASRRTTVEAWYEGGRLLDLRVTPEAERSRVKALLPEARAGIEESRSIP